MAGQEGKSTSKPIHFNYRICTVLIFTGHQRSRVGRGSNIPSYSVRRALSYRLLTTSLQPWLFFPVELPRSYWLSLSSPSPLYITPSCYLHLSLLRRSLLFHISASLWSTVQLVSVYSLPLTPRHQGLSDPLAHQKGTVSYHRLCLLLCWGLEGSCCSL